MYDNAQLLLLIVFCTVIKLVSSFVKHMCVSAEVADKQPLWWQKEKAEARGRLEASKIVRRS